MSTKYKFSTPEGIELTITIQEQGLVDDVWALDFTVEVNVPGYVIANFSLPPWSKLLDIRAYRDPEQAKWEHADYLHNNQV